MTDKEKYKLYQKEYRLKNPEKRKESQRKYYQKNKKKLNNMRREYQKKYREDHKEYYLDYSKNYYKSNKVIWEQTYEKNKKPLKTKKQTKEAKYFRSYYNLKKQKNFKYSLEYRKIIPTKEELELMNKAISIYIKNYKNYEDIQGAAFIGLLKVIYSQKQNKKEFTTKERNSYIVYYVYRQLMKNYNTEIKNRQRKAYNYKEISLATPVGENNDELINIIEDKNKTNLDEELDINYFKLLIKKEFSKLKLICNLTHRDYWDIFEMKIMYNISMVDIQNKYKLLETSSYRLFDEYLMPAFIKVKIKINKNNPSWR